MNSVVRGVRRLLLAAALCLPFVAPARADEACPPAAQALSAEQLQSGLRTARDRGFLWRIQKNGHSSYLYGTVHVAQAEWMLPGPTLAKALRSSEVLALELDVADPGILARLRAGMAWRADRAVPEPLVERLKAQLRAACLSEQLVTELSPEMLATTLVVLAARRDGLDPSYGIDLVLAGMGHGLKKRVVSLETPELQLAILQGRTPEETQAVVEQALDELESGRATTMLTRIARVWAEGRLDELEHYAQWCDCLNTEEERAQHTRLLDDRNPDLAEHIDALHRSGKRVLAAVGSLHMTGPTGLPTLLAQRGYRVERVTFP
jgi:uncharacterized protein YbaP (TraB family)